MSLMHLLAHIIIYGVLFGALAALLPVQIFVPLAMVLAALHFILRERRRRAEYRSVFSSVKATQIEGFPVIEASGNRSMDDVMLEGLKDVTTELEKKCYQLVEKNIQLLSLKEISLTIISSLNESRIVDSVRSFLSRGLGFKEILVGIFAPESDALHIYTFREAFGQSASQERRVKLDDISGLLARAVMTRKPVFIKDPQMHPLLQGSAARIFEESTMESYLIVPMVKSNFSAECGKTEACVLKDPTPLNDTGRVRDATCAACGRLPVLGVIGVTDGFKAGRLSQADLVAVETLALQISTLLENSQLYNEIKIQETFRDNVINSMMNGLITVDLDGRILLANQATEDIAGYDPTELEGVGIKRLIINNSGDESPMLHALRSGKSLLQHEAFLIKKDGQRLPIILNTSFLMDENRAVQGVLGVFLDLTRIKRMEEKILHLDKLAALGRFSSSMAHEIRNPLTGIVAGLQYLRRVGGIPETQEENISFILSEVNRIDRLITDILNVVRVGDLVYHPVHIESLVRNTVTTLRDVAEQRSVRVVTAFPDEVRTVMIDSDRITQVLINLIKNAVEATEPDGEVAVKVTFPDDGHDVLFDDIRKLVIIEVADNGHGFSEQDKARIFEPFFTTKTEGTGLGLYVTHSIVERHGGYIFVESDEGVGTRFTVYLPVEKVEYGDSSEVGHSASG